MPNDNAAEAVTAATEAVETAADAASSASQAVEPGLLDPLLGPLYYFIMVPMVYLALAFMAAAVLLRVALILRSPAQPFQLALYPLAKHPRLAALRDAFAMPVVRRRKPVFWAFLMLFHAGVLLLVLGHLDILPQINLMPADSRHMLGWGGVGVAVTLPLFYFLLRRFRGPDREISTPADYLLLLLLLFLALLGDLMSWGNSWTARGFVMTKQDFALYFDGLRSFSLADPRELLHGSHYHFVVLHVLLANLFFIVLPFTKIMHTFLAVPINLLRRLSWKNG